MSEEMRIGCRDDTMPKTMETRRHCKVWLRARNNLPQPPPYISFFWGCGRLHALNHTLQCLLVSIVFGMVSSLHPISFILLWVRGAACFCLLHNLSGYFQSKIGQMCPLVKSLGSQYLNFYLSKYYLYLSQLDHP